MSLLASLASKVKSKTDMTPKRAKKHGVVNDEGGVIGFLTEQDGLDDRAARIQGVVNGDLIHSTALPDLCPRQVALMRYSKQGFIHTGNRITSNDRLVWATGRAFEEHIRNQLIDSFGKHSVAGIFKCDCGHLKGGKDLTGAQMGEISEGKCSKCNSLQSNYHELVVRLPEFHTTHGPDFPYFNAKNQTVVVEIKSIKKGDLAEKSKGGFVNLVAPQKDNLRQVFMYHRVAKMKNANVAPYVVLIYACKQHIGRANPYKEFKINVNDPQYRHIYDSNEALLDKGKVVKMIDKTGKVSKEFDCGDGFPERTCPFIDCTTAKKCQVAGLCFSLNGGKE